MSKPKTLGLSLWLTAASMLFLQASFSLSDAAAAGRKRSSKNTNLEKADTGRADPEKADSEKTKPEKTSSGKTDSESSKSQPSKSGSRHFFSGNASWYGIPFHGRKTASGETFDMYKLSAAHLTLPLPTKALVEEPRSGNVVMVKVNDRGPYAKSRVMDLSREAARQLGTLSRGVAFVEVTVIQRPKKEN